MKIKVEGGTHLGIKGCYGEKVFEVDNKNDVHNAVEDDISLKQFNLSKYKKVVDNYIYRFIDGSNKTIFEYQILEIIK